MSMDDFEDETGLAIGSHAFKEAWQAFRNQALPFDEWWAENEDLYA